MSKTKRIYNGSDGYMLETSGALQLLFLENIADFTAFDSTLDAGFATAWATKITEAGSVTQHTQVNDILGQKTELVLSKIDECKIKYNEVKFFSNKAFPDSDFHQKEFGTQDYDKARRYQTGMIRLMDKIAQSCIKYTTELLAVGMSQPQIDATTILHDELKSLNDQQESYARKKTKLTKMRIKTMNDCYDFTRLVIDAAMVIYTNDYESRKMFVYSPSSGSGADTEILNLLVQEGMPQEVFAVSYNPTRQFVLTNNGPAEVIFYLADVQGGMTAQVQVTFGETTSVTASQLGINGGKLFVEVMPGSGPEADLEVEISL